MKNVHNPVFQTVKLLYYLVCLHSPSSFELCSVHFVHFFLSRTLLCRYTISSKLEPSFADDIKMAPGLLVYFNMLDD